MPAYLLATSSDILNPIDGVQTHLDPIQKSFRLLNICNDLVNFYCFFKNGPIPASFSSFLHDTIINSYKLRWLLGTQNRGSGMEGADESTVLWRHLKFYCFCYLQFESDGLS